MNQKQIDELKIDLANDSDEVGHLILSRMLGFINKHVEDGKESVNIQDFYKHLNKMYKKFGNSGYEG